MNDCRGFTLIEMLGCLAILGIVLSLGVMASKETVSTSLTQFRSISDNEVYEAARAYALENGNSFNDSGISCVNVNDLVLMGYLDKTNDVELLDRYVELRRNEDYVITKITFVDVCS